MQADKKLNDFIEAVRLEFDDFFQNKPNEPLIFFVNSREDMDLIWGRKTEKWFVGAMKNNNIYIINPEALVEVSSHPHDKFWEVLKHEYCHFYYTQVTKTHYPSWLNEGLASSLSGKKLFLGDGYKSKLLNVFDYFSKMDKDGYMIGQYWVEYLLQNFGKEKLQELIKNINQNMDSKKFAKLFFNIYGFKFNKNVFKKFIN